MIRLQFTKPVPEWIERGSPFKVSLRLVNESMARAPASKGSKVTCSLTDEFGNDIPGDPLMHVAVAGSTNPSNSRVPLQATKANTGFSLASNGEIALNLTLCNTCNKQHYGGPKQHNDTCWHSATRPFRLRIDAKLAPHAESDHAVGSQTSSSGKESLAKKGRAGSKKSTRTDLKHVQQPISLFTHQLQVLSESIQTADSAASGIQSLTEEEETLLYAGAGDGGAPCSRAFQTSIGKVFIRELPGCARECTGALLWDGALALCDRLQKLGKQLKGKTVVELGCGTAIPSIVAASMGAKAIATDIGIGVHLGRLCVKENQGIIATGSGDVQVQELLWGDIEQISKIPHGPDFLFASECVYDNESFQPLLDTLKLIIGPKTTCSLILRKRHGCDVERFEDMLKQTFSVQDDQEIFGSDYLSTWKASSQQSGIKHAPKAFIIKLARKKGK